jgi:hypothetical protein
MGASNPLLTLGTISYDPFGPAEERLSAREQRRLAAIVAAVPAVALTRVLRL